MILYDGGPMHDPERTAGWGWSPAQVEAMRMGLARFAMARVAPPCPVDELCVNEGAQRADGTWCRDRAEENGWCAACWAEVAPVGTGA